MKTRPGIERLDKQELTAAKTWLTGRIDAHMNGCLTCKASGPRLRERCDAWWRLARKLHQVKRALRKYDQPDTVGMDMLPGMSEM